MKITTQYELLQARSDLKKKVHTSIEIGPNLGTISISEVSTSDTLTIGGGTDLVVLNDIVADRGITAKGNLTALGSIESGAYIKVSKTLSAGGSIDSGSRILVGTSISAGGHVKAFNSITVDEFGIVAGASVYASKELSVKTRVIAGVSSSIDLNTASIFPVTCETLVSGEVFGRLTETSKPRPENNDVDMDALKYSRWNLLVTWSEMSSLIEKYVERTIRDRGLLTPKFSSGQEVMRDNDPDDVYTVEEMVVLYGLGDGDNMQWCEGEELNLVIKNPECEHTSPSGETWLSMWKNTMRNLSTEQAKVFSATTLRCPTCGIEINTTGDE